jgi:hypothetical protein
MGMNVSLLHIFGNEIFSRIVLLDILCMPRMGFLLDFWEFAIILEVGFLFHQILRCLNFWWFWHCLDLYVIQFLAITFFYWTCVMC